MIRRTTLAFGAVTCAIAGAFSFHAVAQDAQPAETMAGAARKLLSTLEPAQRQKASFSFSSDERLNWHFIPRERKGVSLKEMNAAQRTAALDLLNAGLSESGYQKVGTIRDLEKILLAQEKGSGPVRDPELYFFQVFGEPTDGGTWGWRYEGHHCSLNWTVVKGKTVASSPQFLGTNPAEVRVDVAGAPAKGTRVLRAEEDLARSLVKSLSEEQRAKAVISATAPNDILTSAERKAAIQEDKGIGVPELTQEQRGILLQLIREYANTQAPALARERLQKIRAAGPDKIKFAWMGGIEKDQPHYYRVQGSTFLIEYDNTQNNANHVHSVWRDFNGDFGMDLLAMHYQASPHKVAAAKR
ncbi:MAG: DUF3500 domain-containing protein [Armatimonadota bacterium]